MSNNSSQATPESVWAALDRVAAQQAETDRQIKETDRIVRETTKSQKETDRIVREVSKRLGGMAHSHGSFAEEYFFNSFEKDEKYFFGEKFDMVKKNMTGMETDDEFDIVFLNGKAVAIVEVKYKAHENDLPKIMKKADRFRLNFPKSKNHKIYLGIASMAFYPELEKACTDNGIAIIKQAGDTVIINDKNVKAF